MMIDVLPKLRVLGLDNQEAIVAIQSATNGSWYRRNEKRSFTLECDLGAIAEVKFNSKLTLSSILMTENCWLSFEPIISEELRLRSDRIARTTLFCVREVKGYARVDSWLQIRPVGLDLKDRTPIGALTISRITGVPLPFALEVVYAYSSLPLLEAYRRIRSVQQAIWLLTAFIDIPIFQIAHPYSWAFLENSFQLVQCGMGTGLEDVSDEVFSDVSEFSPLEIVEREAYYSELGINASNFRVPDLDVLWCKYSQLSTEDKLRFQRACSSLSSATHPGINESQKLIALVSAIEPLIEPGKRCVSCRNHIGVTGRFSEFLGNYVSPPAGIKDLYMDIYQARSKVVHGSHRFEVDEPFLSIPLQSDLIPLAAWDSTKRGLINWLLKR